MTVGQTAISTVPASLESLEDDLDHYITQSLYRLKSSVTTVMIYVDLFQRHQERGNTDALQTHLARIRETNWEMCETAEQLLQVAQIYAISAVPAGETKAASCLNPEPLTHVSHEVRALTSAIELSTAVLERRGLWDEKSQKIAGQVGLNGKRMLDLLVDLFDFTRLESGRLELVHAPIDLYERVDYWREQAQLWSRQTGVNFAINMAPDTPTMIYGNEHILNKMVLKLLGNAFRFTHRGRVTLHIQAYRNTWEIRVQDTGIGIPASKLADLFILKPATEESPAGLNSGLRLTTVYRMARAIGGSISVESTIGQGSVFSIALPDPGKPAPQTRLSSPMF